MSTRYEPLPDCTALLGTLRTMDMMAFYYKTDYHVHFNMHPNLGGRCARLAV